MQRNKLEQCIIATLNYFGIFEYPLTLFEIRKNLINLEKTSPTPLCERGEILDNGVSDVFTMVDIEDALNGERLKNMVGEKNGFYFLAQNNSNYLARQQRYYFADQKFKQAKKIAWMLSKIPYIKMIAVCNSLGYGNTREDSDIDLFVVTAKNRVWATRLLSVMLIKFLDLRPKEGRLKDTICMSFFVDENNLNLEKFKISENDIYLTFWVTQVFPIYDKGGIYDKFFKENEWIKKTLPNVEKREVEFGRRIFPARESSASWRRDSCGAEIGIRDCGGAGTLPNSLYQGEELNKNSVQPNWLEKFSKKIQLKFMNSRLKELANKDTRVVVNDGVLKLFAVDRREEYMNRWLRSFL